MNATTPVPSWQYDASAVNQLLTEEIHEFVRHLSEPTLSYDQELRGGLIAWLCYFLPELVTQQTSKLLLDSYEANRTSYFERWYQLLPLEMAMFGLTREQGWLNGHKQNLAYGGSLLRYYVMQSLALAVPDLQFDDEGLREPIKRGLSIPYFEAEWGAAMLAMCKGESGAKRAALRRWHGTYFLNRAYLLKSLSEGKPIENWFFLRPFFRIQTYAIHRLCSPRLNPMMASSPACLFVGSLTEQVEKHPMMQSFLEIAGA